MNLPRALHTLQTIDLDLETKAKRLQAVQASIGEAAALDAARSVLDQAEAALRHAQSRQQELDLEVRSLEQKVTNSERDLMSGRVRNPKELGGMQANIESMRRHHQELEDQLLEAMVVHEEQKEQCAQAEAAFRKVEAQWREKQARLQAESHALQQDQARLGTERQMLVGRLDAATLAAYDQLRQRRGGYAVSGVKRGSCQVCGVTLPTRLVQSARREEILEHCGSCGRILYVLD